MVRVVHSPRLLRVGVICYQRLNGLPVCANLPAWSRRFAVARAVRMERGRSAEYGDREKSHEQSAASEPTRNGVGQQ